MLRSTGLGDRHGENLLVDASCGDVVQVDFSMLFDKGLTLAAPEMVPFRLTQNMIDAFGVEGVEGPFSASCCMALKVPCFASSFLLDQRNSVPNCMQVMRTHRDTILSVLETFVHDPLMEWHGHEAKPEAETFNPMAQDALTTMQGAIERRTRMMLRYTR